MLLEALEPRQLLATHAIADFFPLSAPSTWSYAGTLNGEPATATTNLAAGPTLSGIPTSRLRTVVTPDGGGTSTIDARFYAHTATGLRLLQQNTIEPDLTTTTLFGAGVRFFTPQVNDGATIRFVKSLSGSSNDGRSWTGRFTGDVTVVGIESIDTSAGSFQALKVTLNGNITQNGSTGWTAAGTVAETRWLVRGVGTARVDYVMFLDASDEAPRTLRYNMGLTSSSRLGTVTDVLVKGKGVVIPFGDTSPGAGDGTNFAGVDVNGGTKTRIFKIQNTSNHPITLAPGTHGLITLSGQNADNFVVVRQPAQTLQPGQVTLFSVRFDPSTTGFRFASVSFASQSDPTHPFHFDIRGTGIFIGRIHVSAAASGLEIDSGTTTTSTGEGTRFGRVEAIGNNTVQRTYIISNSGVGNLALNGAPRVAISGNGAEDFTVITNPSGSIAPGQTSSFTIRFNPSALGGRNAVVSIFSNDRFTPTFTFAIAGTGIA